MFTNKINLHLLIFYSFFVLLVYFILINSNPGYSRFLYIEYFFAYFLISSFLLYYFYSFKYLYLLNFFLFCLFYLFALGELFASKNLLLENFYGNYPYYDFLVNYEIWFSIESIKNYEGISELLRTKFIGLLLIFYPLKLLTEIFNSKLIYFSSLFLFCFFTIKFLCDFFNIKKIKYHEIFIVATPVLIAPFNIEVISAFFVSLNFLILKKVNIKNYFLFGPIISLNSYLIFFLNSSIFFINIIFLIYFINKFKLNLRVYLIFIIYFLMAFICYFYFFSFFYDLNLLQYYLLRTVEMNQYIGFETSLFFKFFYILIINSIFIGPMSFLLFYKPRLIYENKLILIMIIYLFIHTLIFKNIEIYRQYSIYYLMISIYAFIKLDTSIFSVIDNKRKSLLLNLISIFYIISFHSSYILNEVRFHSLNNKFIIIHDLPQGVLIESSNFYSNNILFLFIFFIIALFLFWDIKNLIFLKFFSNDKKSL